MDEELRLLQEQFDAGYISEAIYNQRKQAIEEQSGLYPAGELVHYYAFGQPHGFSLGGNQFQTQVASDGQDPLQKSNYFYDFGQPYDNSGQVGPLYQDGDKTWFEDPQKAIPRLTPKPVQTIPVSTPNPIMPIGQAKDSNEGNTDLFSKLAPFFNPYGSNVQTDLYQLGSFLGMPKGSQGRGMGVASSAAALGLGAGRTLMSGFANSRQTARAQEEERRRMAQRSYTPQMQYVNTNYLGGTL